MRVPTLCALTVGVAGLAALGGCSDAVDPTLGTDQAFSLYGYLDPTADRQALRVVPITPTLEGDSAAVLDVAVTSTEPATGRTATWRDSAVTYVDGSRGHVFVADYTPTAGATVEIRVQERAGERRTAAVAVAVPEIARPEVGAADVGGGEVTYPVRLAAPRVLSTTLVYHVVGWPEAPADTVAIPYAAVAPLAEAGAETWALDLLFLQTSRAFLASREVGGARLKLVSVSLEAFVGNEAWAVPPGGFDLDAIVEPGTFSNVTGGFGFVGAGYRTAVGWEPSPVTQSRAGFVVTEDPASSLFLNEVSADGWVELYNPTLEAIPIGGYTLVTDLGASPIPSNTVVEPQGFMVLDALLATGPQRVELQAPDGETALQLEIPNLTESDFGSDGAYPDGRSRFVGEFDAFRNFDLFRGRCDPTPGAPNRIHQPAPVVNEVFTEGLAGWAEAYLPGRYETSRLTSNPDLPFNDWVRIESGVRIAVADEAAGRLGLPQAGGEVVLAVQFHSSVPPRVVDVRTYGPQAPKRSSGLLPDGDLGGWRTGLMPTRGAPNAAARFNL